MYDTPRGPCVVLQPGYSLIDARVKAAIAKLEPGEFTEGHQLDAKMAKRIPKKAIGRCLSASEAAALLKKL